MSQDKRGNNGDDGNVLVKVTVRRGNARAMGATPGTTVRRGSRGSRGSR